MQERHRKRTGHKVGDYEKAEFFEPFSEKELCRGMKRFLDMKNDIY